MTRELTPSVVPSGSQVPVPSSGLLSTWSTRDWSDGIHIADLAQRWAAGERVALLFTEVAVQANAESTLTLTPAR